MKKKILSFGIILVLIITLFSLTGCGENKENSQSNKNTENSSVSEKTETLASQVVEEFYTLSNDKKVDDMFNLIDFVGMYTYMSLAEDEYKNFSSEYAKVKESDEWKDAESSIEENIQEVKKSFEDELESESIQTKVTKTDVEEIGDSFYKVTATVETEDADGKNQAETLEHYVYNTGKEYKIVYAEGL